MFSVVSGSLSGGSGVGEEKRLDAMNAVCVYVSTAQLVLQFDTTDSNGLGEQRMLDLSRLFGQLRQLLSCAVCARLLNDPYEPLNNARCQHNVCRLCVRGRKALRPLCINCKDLQDFKTYTENKTMRCLLLCYKSLCEHLLSSNFYTHLSRQKAHQALTCSGENVFGVAPMPHMTTCGDIIQEGARYDDILNAFNADLPQIGPTIKLQNTLLTIPAAVTSLPNQSTPSVSAVTPLAPLLVPQKRVQSHTAPRLSTSPITPAATTSNSITLLPTHPAIIKREQTNNQGNSSTPSNAHILMTSKVNVTNQQQQQQQAHGQSHMLYVRNIKTSASESNNIQTPHLCATQSIVGTSHSSIASLSAPPTITYVGPNTPGIVVPIVSSSATTTAPLTIASAKLQSLKRQLAQAQARGGAPISIASAVKAAGITNSDTNASVTFKVSAAGITTTSSLISSASTGAVASPTSVTSATATTTTATITSQQIRNPPSIKTVSNGSAMYSVLYTGVGNKITIKRKTDGDEENGQRKTVATANSPVSTSTSTPPAISNSVITTQQQSQANKLNAKRRGCRCGNATPTPGKLTCCGQRCPCYVDSKSCIGCKCRGCRNPHRPDGGKVRPVIPELACYEIQVADETPRLSPSELQVGTTLSTRPRNTSTATTTSPQQHPTHQQAITIVSEQQSTSSTALSSPSPSIATVTSQLHLTPNSSSPSSKGATLIPFISLHPISSQQQQQQQQQQTQTVTTISSNQHQTNMLPMESVLIQNAEGKYQVVNVVTTGQAHHQHSNSNIQRIHSIPQLQVTSSANGSSNHSNTLLSNLTTVNILTNTSTSNTTTSPSTATTKSSHQSVLLQQQPHIQQHRVQQQQQQKHHQQQIHGQRLVSSHLITTSANNMPTSVTSGKCVAANSLPLQLQHHHHQQQQQQQSQMHNNTHTQNQQVKQNIVTMRPATISNNNMHHTQTLTPILSSSATTITLSPIIVSSSPNTFKAEMFSDSMESEYLNFTTCAVTSTTMVNSGSNNTNMLSTIYSHSGLSNASTSTRITSVPSLSSGSTGSGSGSASRMSLGMNMNITGAGSHITPALVEVIEASDM